MTRKKIFPFFCPECGNESKNKQNKFYHQGICEKAKAKESIKFDLEEQNYFKNLNFMTKIVLKLHI